MSGWEELVRDADASRDDSDVGSRCDGCGLWQLKVGAAEKRRLDPAGPTDDPSAARSVRATRVRDPQGEPGTVTPMVGTVRSIITGSTR